MIDYVEKALGRVIWQYRKGFTGAVGSDDLELTSGDTLELTSGDELELTSTVLDEDKPAFQRWMEILPRMLQQEAETPLNLLNKLLDLNSQQGAQLDMVGRLVRQERGTAGDALYRLLLRARIYNNASDASIDSTVRAVRVMTEGTGVKLIDPQDETFLLEFDGPVADSTVKLLLDEQLVPRPQGIELAGMIVPQDVLSFGVQELDNPIDESIGGFNELGDTDGGAFTELY